VLEVDVLVLKLVLGWLGRVGFTLTLLGHFARKELVSVLAGLIPSTDLPLLAIKVGEGSSEVRGFGVGSLVTEQHEAVFIVVWHVVFCFV